MHQFPDDQIDAWVKIHQADLIEFLSHLVQIPSEACPPGGNELECQRFVEQAYRAAGAEVDVFTPDEVPGLREHPGFFPLVDGQPRQFHNRPDVVGRFRGRGGGRSLLFSTHVDTVSCGDAKVWKEAGPFSGLVKDGKLYGRGSWDTKWGIAASLFAVHCVQELGFVLSGDVLLESVVDEEFGGSHGSLAARLRGYQADVAINSEPTNMVTAPAHRGGTAWKITTRGDAGRGFAGQVLSNPVYQLAKIIEAIRLYDQQRTPAIPPHFYESDPALSTYIQQIGGGGDVFSEAIGDPGDCYLSLWTEEHPGTDFETHQKKFIGFIKDYLASYPDFDGVFPEFTQQFRYIPGSVMNPEHPFFQCLERGFASSGLDFVIDGAKFACDTYVFNMHSPTPALTLGPRGGNAHAPDEYVLVKDVFDLTRMYARCIVDWCGVRE
jgi:acetylornithine deacetylase